MTLFNKVFERSRSSALHSRGHVILTAGLGELVRFRADQAAPYARGPELIPKNCRLPRPAITRRRDRLEKSFARSYKLVSKLLARGSLQMRRNRPVQTSSRAGRLAAPYARGCISPPS